MHIDYLADHPARPGLLVEVADSSLLLDRHHKGSAYARAGLPDYWIVNLVDGCLEVHRDPKSGYYQSLTTYRAGDEVRPLLFTECPLRLSLLFQ